MLDLLDNPVPIGSFNDLLHVWEDVLRVARNHEAGTVLAYGLILVQAHIERLGALGVCALAHPVGAWQRRVQRHLADPVVYLAEDRLVMRCALLQHDQLRASAALSHVRSLVGGAAAAPNRKLVMRA